MGTIKLRDVDGVDREIPLGAHLVFGMSFDALCALRDEYDRRGGPTDVTPKSIREVFSRLPVSSSGNITGFSTQVSALAKGLARDHEIQVNSVKFYWVDTFGTRVGRLEAVKVFTETRG
jgi:hypothetical protein